jgi:DNA-binding transcriptional MocR family regulator
MAPIIQNEVAPGLVDLGSGRPFPAALPVAQWRDSQVEALGEYSWQALTYGHNTGPAPLQDWLCERLAATDARAPVPDEVFVTAGASQGIELVSTVLTRPGDVVLVDSPTYHLALRILADRDVELVGVPADDAGLDPAGTAELLHRLRRAGRRVPLLYLVPTFANPTGGCLPPERRAALVELARATGTVVVEDDTYREMAFDGPAPPSLWSAGPDAVVRVGSFAKSVGPGLRLGFLTARPEFVRTLADRGYVDSGGGLNHATALAMAVLGRSGRYAAHVAEIRSRYRTHRDALVAALRAEAPALDPVPPRGGWFLWLRAPGSATELLAAARARGVSFVPGPAFHAGRAGGADRLRLSFSMYDPGVLAEGARRLGQALAGH